MFAGLAFDIAAQWTLAGTDRFVAAKDDRGGVNDPEISRVKDLHIS